MLFSSYLYALSYAKGSFRMFLTFVTGGHGGDGYVILGWLIFISIFMSCKDDMDFIWTWTKIWTLLDRIPMIYSISNVFDFNIHISRNCPFLAENGHCDVGDIKSVTIIANWWQNWDLEIRLIIWKDLSFEKSEPKSRILKLNLINFQIPYGP